MTGQAGLRPHRPFPVADPQLHVQLQRWRQLRAGPLPHRLLHRQSRQGHRGILGTEIDRRRGAHGTVSSGRACASRRALDRRSDSLRSSDGTPSRSSSRRRSLTTGPSISQPVAAGRSSGSRPPVSRRRPCAHGPSSEGPGRLQQRPCGARTLKSPRDRAPLGI